MTEDKHSKMATQNLKKLTVQLENQEKTLIKLRAQWNTDSVLKRMSEVDQSNVFKAAVMAKTLTSSLIPKLKAKIKFSLADIKNERLYMDVIREWNVVEAKVTKALETFEKLESCRATANKERRKVKKEKDEVLSKSIEQSLKERRSKSKQNVKPNTSSEYDLDLSTENGSIDGTDEHDKTNSADELAQGEVLNSETTSTKSTLTKEKDKLDEFNDLKTFLSGAGDIAKTRQNSHNFTKLLSKEKFKEELEQMVKPEDAAAMSDYVTAFTACSLTEGPDEKFMKAMLKDVRGDDDCKTVLSVGETEDEQTPRETRDPFLKAMAKDIQRIKSKRDKMFGDESEWLTEDTSDSRQTGTPETSKNKGQNVEKDLTIEKAHFSTIIPIDSMLSFVEIFPAEAQEMVKEQTNALKGLQSRQLFNKNKPFSEYKGQMVSMDKLRREYRDDRFDASDYHLRVPDSLIEEDHLKLLKHEGIDNAVGRYFGSYQIDVEHPMARYENIPTPYMKPTNDPQELLEKYNMRKINALEFDKKNKKSK